MNESALRELPDGWMWTRLEDACIELIGGGTPSREIPEYFGGNILWLTPTEVPKNKISILKDSKEKITESGLKNSSARIIPKDSVLLTSRASIGYVAIAGIDVTTNQGFASFVCSDAIYNFFLAYWLWANKQILESNATGTTFKEISKSKLREIHIPLPPLPEQRRIVTKLEELFTRLDAGVSELKKTQAQLKRYHQSVLKAACEGKLVPTEAELAKAEGREYEVADVLLVRILKERREKWNGKGKYKEPAAQDIGGLSELPEGWSWASADQLTTIITDGEHITPERSESGVLLLSARNVLDGKLSLKDVDYVPHHVYMKLSQRLKIEPGDVLLSCSGSVGRSCVAPEGLTFSLVRSVAVLKPVIKAGNYLSYCLRSHILQSQIIEKKTQTAQANIFQGKIKSLKFPLPPLAEQRRIVAEVERRLSIADGVEKTVTQSLAQAERLRQSILKKAFEGRLVAQDASDEPAGVLLERIKAEKARRGEKKRKK